MGKRARAWAVEHFSPTARIDDFLDLYRADMKSIVPKRSS
jgi:hypothetical protein